MAFQKSFETCRQSIFAATMRSTSWRATPFPDRGARPTLAEFDQARARVASLDLVGVQSRLQAFARALFDHFGWGAPPDAPRRNAAAAPLRFSPLALQMIKDANQYDYQLYQDACARSE